MIPKMEDNLNLIKKTAHKFATSWKVPQEDLEQEAAIAWMRAEKDFDPASGCKFTTFATTYMHNACAAYQAKYRYTLSVGGTDLRMPYIAEKERSAQINEIESNIASLNKKIGHHDTTNDSQTTLADIIPSGNDCPLEQSMREDEIDLVYESFKVLSKKEQKIIHSLYIESLSVRETSKKIKVSENRIYQLRRLALEKMREFLANKL